MNGEQTTPTPAPADKPVAMRPTAGLIKTTARKLAQEPTVPPTPAEPTSAEPAETSAEPTSAEPVEAPAEPTSAEPTSAEPVEAPAEPTSAEPVPTTSAEPVEASAEPTSAEPVEASSGRWRRAWQLLAVTLALVAMVAGVGDWWRAAHSDTLALAQQRDAVLIAATGDVATLNTLDYRHVQSGLAQWATVTTGTLHDQVTQVSAAERKLLADQQKISVGKVVDAAVFSLSGDTATVLASVEVTVKDGTNPSAPATVKRNRFSASMVEVNGTWLVENLEQVAVNIS